MKRWIIPFIPMVVLLGCDPHIQLPSDLSENMMITGASGTEQIDFYSFVERLTAADVVFIGEIHDDSLTHVLELALLEAIHRKNKDIAVAMEMFERDVQGQMDGYLAGDIEEEEFLTSSRPWNNYSMAYRPLVEFAKEHGLPVIAMNVPRRYARMVAMMGEDALADVPEDERAWMASELKVLDDKYKERFLGVMGKNRSGPMGRMNPENMYLAHCLKDDTMAESIHTFLETHPGMTMVSYQGDFHSAFRLGIVQKLSLLNDDVESLVVSVIPVENVETVRPDQFVNQGDYLVFVERIQGS